MFRNSRRNFFGSTTIALAIIFAMSIIQSSFAAGPARPVVRYNTLCAANGSLLRGMPINIGKQNSAAVNSWGTSLSNLRNFRDQLHQNAVRICFFDGRFGDSRAITMNEVLSYTDAIVANAESLGIYVIIDYHSALEVYGTGQVWDPLKWWALMAPRYKDRTCVIYELLNEPCCCPPGPLANDSAIYAIVRKAAPSTPVLHISTMSIGGSWVGALITLAGKCGFDWKAGRDVFGYHTYGGSQSQYIIELQAAGIPSLCTEWGYAEDPWKPAVFTGYERQSEFFERVCMSWIDWHDWQVGNPLDHGLNLLLPDAIAKKYAWWLSTPSAPAGVAGQAVDAATIRLTWGKPADTGNGLKEYLIYRNGGFVAATEAPAFTDTGLTAATAYGYEISALCVGAIESPRSAMATITTPADAAPPAVSLASGAGDGRMVRIVFSKPVEQSSAQTAANYAIDNGVLISSAALGEDRKTVLLTTSPLAKNIPYACIINNVRDRAASPNTIAANTRVVFQYVNGTTRIRLYPRPNYLVPAGTRLLGGTFEGANGSPTAGPYTTLQVLPLSAPSTGWTDIAAFLNFDAGYRYIRFRLSSQARCNVAELELWSGAAKAVGTPFGTAAPAPANDFTKAFDGATATYFDCSQSDSSYVGLDISGWVDAAKATEIRAPADACPMTVFANPHRIEIMLPAGLKDRSATISIFDLHGGLVRMLPRAPARDGRVVIDGSGIIGPGEYVIAVKAGTFAGRRMIAIPE